MTSNPYVGPGRFIVRLPGSATCRDLAFDGLGRDIGNGWFDVTARIVAAVDSHDEQWLPMSVPSLRNASEILHDQRRPLLGPVRRGDISRRPNDDGGWAYALYDGKRWCDLDVLVVAPSPEYGAISADDRRDVLRALDAAAG